MSGDDERPRRSWREIDQMRGSPRGGRDDSRPRGRHAEAQAKQATASYVKELDKLFVSGGGGAEGEALAHAIRDAHGSPELPAACRAYLDQLGLPRDVALLALFLDTRDATLVVPALEGLLSIANAGELEVSGGLRSQLRLLADGADNSIADAAEDLLDSIGA